jgi:hypothetical protein
VEVVDGRKISQEVVEYTQSFPRDSWRDWLLRSAGGLISNEQIATIESSVRSLERLPNLDGLLQATVPARADARKATFEVGESG